MPESNYTRKPVWIKWGLLLLAVIAVSLLILLLIFWFKPPFLTYWVENNVNKKLTKASQGLYHFAYSGIQVDLASQSVHILDFTVFTDSLTSEAIQKTEDAPEVMINFKARKVTGQGVSIFSMLLFNTLKIDQLVITQPVIHLNLTGNKKNPAKSNQTLTENFSGQALQVIKAIRINAIQLTDGNMVVVDQRVRSELQAGLYNFDITLKDIFLKNKQKTDTSLILGARQFKLAAARLELPSRNELYTFTMDSLKVNSLDSSLSVGRVHYKPLYSKKEFHQKTGKAIERMDLQFNQISTSGADIRTLVNHQKLKIRHLYITDGLMDFFKNMLYPKPEKNFIGKYPHQLLMKSKFKITVDSVSLHDIKVQYGIIGANTGKAGIISFDHTHGTITNLTNDSLRITRIPLCKVDVNSRFMDKSILNAYFRFPLNTKNGSFSCGGKMKNFDMSHIDEVVRALMLAGIQSGNTSHLDFNIEATDHHADISMEMVYNNLKIDLYKTQKHSTELKKRTFLMKLLNGIVIHQDNPRKKDPARIGKASVERDTDQSFFNFIWTTIQQPIIRIVTGKDDRIHTKK